MREWFYLKTKLRSFRYVLLDFHKGAVQVNSDLAFLIVVYLNDLRKLQNETNFYKPYPKEVAIRCHVFLQEIRRKVKAMEKTIDFVTDQFL